MQRQSSIIRRTYNPDPADLMPIRMEQAVNAFKTDRNIRSSIRREFTFILLLFAVSMLVVVVQESFFDVIIELEQSILSFIYSEFRESWGLSRVLARFIDKYNLPTLVVFILGRLWFESQRNLATRAIIEFLIISFAGSLSQRLLDQPRPYWRFGANPTASQICLRDPLGPEPEVLKLLLLGHFVKMLAKGTQNVYAQYASWAFLPIVFWYATIMVIDGQAYLIQILFTLFFALVAPSLGRFFIKILYKFMEKISISSNSVSRPSFLYATLIFVFLFSCLSFYQLDPSSSRIEYVAELKTCLDNNGYPLPNNHYTKLIGSYPLEEDAIAPFCLLGLAVANVLIFNQIKSSTYWTRHSKTKKIFVNVVIGVLFALFCVMFALVINYEKEIEEVGMSFSATVGLTWLVGYFVIFGLVDYTVYQILFKRLNREIR